MPTWRGFAELAFAESAHLAMARALDVAQTDVDQEHPGAWVIEDRRIALSIEAESSRAAIDAYKRLLGALVAAASGGEVAIEVVNPSERWSLKAASVSVTVPTVDAVDEDTPADDDRLETIRTEAS